jgi:Tol biopolymer transport system component
MDEDRRSRRGLHPAAYRLFPFGLTLVLLVVATLLRNWTVGRNAEPVPGRTGPRNGAIVFTRDRDLFTIDPDSQKVTQLTDSTQVDRDPAWSPGRGQLAFVRDVDLAEPPPGTSPAPGDQQLDLFVISPGVTEARGLTHDLSVESSPAWSPDASAIAYSATEPSGCTDIWVVVLASDEARRLTHCDGESTEPSWSPDGRWIAYAAGHRAGQGDHSSIYRIDPDGEHDRLLVDLAGHGVGDPAWSPNGRAIALVRSVHRQGDLYVFRGSGKQPLRLTHSGAVESDPAWSPDGHWIVVAAGGNLYRVSARRGRREHLTDGEPIDSTPSWGAG